MAPRTAVNLWSFCYFLSLLQISEAMNCSQCNIRFMGVRNLCTSPRNVSGCIGCMKTVAKVKLRDSGYIDGWERDSVVVSRLCITPGNINVKPAGCYKQQNNGGYTERCYCYTNNCNSGAKQRLLDRACSVLIILSTAAVFIRQANGHS